MLLGFFDSFSRYLKWTYKSVRYDFNSKKLKNLRSLSILSNVIKRLLCYRIKRQVIFGKCRSFVIKG